MNPISYGGHRTRAWRQLVAFSAMLLGGLALSMCGGSSAKNAAGSEASGGNGSASSGGSNTASGGQMSTGSGGSGSNVSNAGGTRNATCEAATSSGDVQQPTFWKNLAGQTSWFASPVVADLDHDGRNELIAAYYATYVFDDKGNLLSKAEDGSGRVYAPHVVADLEGDGITEVVVGNDKNVIAYEWKSGKLALKAGFPVDTTSGGSAPEVRGLAAGDLNGDGTLEIVATTTQTVSTENGGAQVFVFEPDGTLYQPAGISWQAWPRYNNLTGTGNDADRNGIGHHGYGCYGLNVGIGNIDDDDELEVIATYDNHNIQAFDHDGVAIDAAPYFKDPDSMYLDQPMTWGQFIRWADHIVEENHYNKHTGDWPNPGNGDEWLQWTASPPNIVDLDLDGKNEVVGVPNVEKNEPYETQAYAIMALMGAHDGGKNSAMRKPGWETLPRGNKPIQVDGYYPPGGIPAAVTVDLQGDARPEVIVSLNDGGMYAFDASGAQLWRFDYSLGKAILYASEPTIADLNQDGSPEVLFATFGDPDDSDAGHLVILAADGAKLHDVPLPNPGHNGNGNGAPAAPAVFDLDGDGELEVFVQTFDHGMDIFKVPGSATNCLLWPTARGGALRMGQPSGL